MKAVYLVFEGCAEGARLILIHALLDLTTDSRHRPHLRTLEPCDLKSGVKHALDERCVLVNLRGHTWSMAVAVVVVVVMRWWEVLLSRLSRLSRLSSAVQCLVVLVPDVPVSLSFLTISKEWSSSRITPLRQTLKPLARDERVLNAMMGVLGGQRGP